jgi:hypothetical protein
MIAKRTSDPHAHKYIAKNGKVFVVLADGERLERHSAMSNNGKDLERFDAALSKARDQWEATYAKRRR